MSAESVEKQCVVKKLNGSIREKLEEDGTMTALKCDMLLEVVRVLKKDAGKLPFVKITLDPKRSHKRITHKEGEEKTKSHDVKTPAQGKDATFATTSCALKVGQAHSGRTVKEDNKSAKLTDGDDLLSDVRIRTVNKLVMDYFRWKGLNNAAEMLHLESLTKNSDAQHKFLVDHLGETQNDKVPHLVEHVANLMEKEKQRKKK